MSESDRALLVSAAELRRPLARAARTGAGNGLGYAIFGGLSIAFAVMSWDFIGLALGGVLLGVGLSERAQATRLLGGDRRAPLLLARGELVLLGALVLYALLGFLMPPVGIDELQRQIGSNKAFAIDVRRMAKLISTAWYGTVLATALLYQGGMARYFLRRRSDVARYLDEVPDWARRFVESMP